MVFTITALIGGLVSAYIFLRLLLRYTQDPKEPPAIERSIPFLSPIIGMATQKTQYYSRIRDKHNLPIYTLRMPGTRLYVVNSTSLISAVQRQSLTIAFAPLEVNAAIRLTGATDAGKSILRQNLDSKGNRDEIYIVSYGKAIHHALSPGTSSLEALSRAAIRIISQSLERIETPKVVGLFDWVRHEISSTTAESVYGPLNPFRDPKVEAAFWNFVPEIVILLLNFFPSVLAKDTLKARSVLVQAFEDYFANGGYNHGSALIKARYSHSKKYNVSLTDLARFEVAGSIASLATTGPTAFWLVYHIFSDPIVLEDIRSEVLNFVVPSSGGSGNTIDMTKIKELCPILSSTFQEVLRFHAVVVSPRLVMEDHLLDGKYLLKKGNTVMIPATVQHSSSIWGDNVAEFYHKRFVWSESRKPAIFAFRGFGGGAHLCPGRHFARTEILTFVVLMVLQFDVTPVSGEWTRPTTRNSDVSLTMPVPDKEIMVELTRKTGTGLEDLNVILSGSDETTGLTAKDMRRD